jgi:NitT/TauT family transport system ATP-binding protein
LEQDLEVDGVTKRYGAHVAVDALSLAVAHGSFFSILGPSGCGKTTLMRMVGGLDTPSEGTIRLDGRDVGAPDRRRGMVFQSYSSFPWLTVAENVAYGMRYRDDMTEDEKTRRRDHYLWLVGLKDFANAYPNKVSGGMRQRIAIARTLAAGSDVLLMDEPFGALDAQRREDLQLELRRIHRADAKTIIFVTHDVDEAVFLADRIVVFSKRPARILEELDIAAELGPDRTIELRDSERFFRLRTQVLQYVRTAAAEAIEH